MVYVFYANVVNKGIGDKTHGTPKRVYRHCIAVRFGCVQKNDANCPYANYSIFAESKCSQALSVSETMHDGNDEPHRK